MIHLRGTGPQKRLSSDSPRLSPIMNQCPAGTLMGIGRLHPRPRSPAHVSEMYESLSRLPLRYTWPLRTAIVSPGRPTTRLMKLTDAFVGVGRPHAWPSRRGGSPQGSLSDPAGGWKTTTSPTSGSPKRLPSRLTRTRWPISRVGTIDSLGMRYGL